MICAVGQDSKTPKTTKSGARRNVQQGAGAQHGEYPSECWSEPPVVHHYYFNGTAPQQRAENDGYWYEGEWWPSQNDEEEGWQEQEWTNAQDWQEWPEDEEANA